MKEDFLCHARELMEDVGVWTLTNMLNPLQFNQLALRHWGQLKTRCTFQILELHNHLSLILASLWYR